MIAKKKKKATRKAKPMMLTRAQLKKLKGGWDVLHAHPFCDASPKGSRHDCGAASITG